MQKNNKIFMRIVVALLCLALLSTSMLSGIFAKFAYQKDATAGVSFKRWGITIDAGSDISTAAVNVGADGVSVNANAVEHLAPGTHGCFVWFLVESDNPEVPFKIDFSGNASIGDGYHKESKLIKDDHGKPVDYFPIVFYLVAYDYNATTGQWVKTTTKNDMEAAETTDSIPIDFSLCVRKKKSGSYYYTLVDSAPLEGRLSYSGDLKEEKMEALLNGTADKYTSASLNNVFDQTFALDATTGKAASFKRVYTIQWCWPYNAADTSYPKSNYAGTAGPYTSQWLDTQLGEAILKDTTNSRFNIKFDMSVNIMQVQ